MVHAIDILDPAAQQPKLCYTTSLAGVHKLAYIILGSLICIFLSVIPIHQQSTLDEINFNNSDNHDNDYTNTDNDASTISSDFHEYRIAFLLIVLFTICYVFYKTIKTQDENLKKASACLVELAIIIPNLTLSLACSLSIIFDKKDSYYSVFAMCFLHMVVCIFDIQNTQKTYNAMKKASRELPPVLNASVPLQTRIFTTSGSNGAIPKEPPPRYEDSFNASIPVPSPPYQVHQFP